MAYEIDLTGARSKLERAAHHVAVLVAEIRHAANDDPDNIRLSRAYEQEVEAVVYRIAHVIEIRDHWSLIAGDAVHNMRCALEHLAWQLALKFHDGTVPEAEIRHIQFPIISNREDWAKQRFLRSVSKVDAMELEDFQPFNIEAANDPESLSALRALAEYSNTDKHRILQLGYLAVSQSRMTGRSESDFKNCRPAKVFEDGSIGVFHTEPAKPPKAGDEIVRVPVIVTGSNPDVELKASLSGFVAVRESWDVMDSLNQMSTFVNLVINRFCK